MPQSIVEQIQEGMELWEKAVGLKPNVCYLGKYEAEQWDRECNKPDPLIGAFVKEHANLLGNHEVPNLTTIEVIIHRVTDRSYIGFGI